MSELSEETRRLLEMGREPVAMQGPHRDRIKRAVLAKILAGSSLALMTTASSVAASTVLKTLVAFGIGASVGIGAIVVKEQVQEPSPTVQAVSSVRIRKVETTSNVEPSANFVLSAPLPSPEVPVASADALLVRRVPSSSPIPEKVSGIVPAEASSAPAVESANVAPSAAPVTELQEEARLIREADLMIRSGNASAAIYLLDEHAARFPNGALSPERSVQRVFALCAIGRKDQARRYAQPLLTAGGPLASRLGSSCVGEK